MAVILTGATGLVGGAVLHALVADGVDVTAIVRSEKSAAVVAGVGATPLVGDVTDADWLQAQLREADAFIHTASPGDATSADFDGGIARAAVAALAGSGKAYLHTGGVWVWGSGDAITESGPFAAPAITAWRAAVEDVVLGADGVRSVIVAPAVVYGRGQGLPSLLTKPDAAGDFRLVGDGQQHWTTVGAEQLADLYLRALKTESAQGYYLGVNDDQLTVAQIAEAAAAHAGTGSVVAETVQESQDRLGAYLADALLLDQVASNARARTELGWNPAGASLLDVIATGGYA